MKHSLEKILLSTLQGCDINKEYWEANRQKRLAPVVKVRRIVSLIAIEQGYSCSKVAKFLHQDRTSILYHAKTLREYMKTYSDYQDLVNKIMVLLGPTPDCQELDMTVGWIARSKSGLLTISPTLPDKMGGYWIAEGTRPYYPQNSFPQIQYDSSPVKVRITVTTKF